MDLIFHFTYSRLNDINVYFCPALSIPSILLRALQMICPNFTFQYFFEC